MDTNLTILKLIIHSFILIQVDAEEIRLDFMTLNGCLKGYIRL